MIRLAGALDTHYHGVNFDALNPPDQFELQNIKFDFADMKFLDFSSAHLHVDASCLPNGHPLKRLIPDADEFHVHLASVYALPPFDPADRWLVLEDACRRYQVAYDILRQAANRGALFSIPHKEHLLVREDSVIQWLQNHPDARKDDEIPPVPPETIWDIPFPYAVTFLHVRPEERPAVIEFALPQFDSRGDFGDADGLTYELFAEPRSKMSDATNNDPSDSVRALYACTYLHPQYLATDRWISFEEAAAQRETSIEDMETLALNNQLQVLSHLGTQYVRVWSLEKLR